MVPSLPQPAADLLRILQTARGEWMTRKQIASQQGKKSLDRYSIGMLDVLVSQNLAEKEKRDNRTPLGEWVYRSMSSDRV